MKLKYILLILIILILGAAGAYWYYFMQGTGEIEVVGNTPSETPGTGFVPFDRTGSGSNTPVTLSTPGGTASPTASSTSGSSNVPVDNIPEARPIPKLRLLSNTPVGGFGASTTASTTLVRWIDRGRGNVYEARNNTTVIDTISNTIFPRIYSSLWNRDTTTFVAQYLETNNTNIRTVSSNIVKRTSIGSTTDTTDNFTSYELKGNTWAAKPVALALSPRKDRVFYLTVENGKGIGYTAGVDGRSITKIFESPLTQLTAEWPEENTIVLVTKASASYNGYVYFVNPKTGTWKKVVGPLPGLNAKVSHDARYILLSATGNENNVLTSIYDTKNNTGTDALVRTIADKCVWGNFYKNLVYCGAPAQLPVGIYPDDWHIGAMPFSDKIWQINATTGEIKVVSTLVDQADRVIDAYQLDLDSRDNYLFFMNKTDLSLWSLDLVAQ